MAEEQAKSALEGLVEEDEWGAPSGPPQGLLNVNEDAVQRDLEEEVLRPESGKLIVLDAGGVVLDGLANTKVVEEVVRLSGVGFWTVNAYFRNQLYLPASRGERTEDWVFEELELRFGRMSTADLESAAKLVTQPLPGVPEALQRLSENAQLWMLSNYIAPWLRGSLSYRGLYYYFKKIFISSETGLRKPDPEAYALVLKAWGRAAADVAFVDDSEANVAAAQEAGMFAILATGDTAAWEASLNEWLGS
jgi:putative hydrolase of the HAD superfamily